MVIDTVDPLGTLLALVALITLLLGLLFAGAIATYRA